MVLFTDFVIYLFCIAIAWLGAINEHDLNDGIATVTWIVFEFVTLSLIFILKFIFGMCRR